MILQLTQTTFTNVYNEVLLESQFDDLKSLVSSSNKVIVFFVNSLLRHIVTRPDCDTALSFAL